MSEVPDLPLTQPKEQPGLLDVAQHGIMMPPTFKQGASNPTIDNAQFRRNGGMPQKPMGAGRAVVKSTIPNPDKDEAEMANGMDNMANAGSPMMQGLGMDPRFEKHKQMEMYNQRMAQPIQGPSDGQSDNSTLQKYQTELMHLEQQNKKRLMAQPIQEPPGGQSDNSALQDYQAQLMLLKQQNKERLITESVQGPPGRQREDISLQDYQAQLMLLKQQNKQRLMAEPVQGPPGRQREDISLQDYQAQLMLLEQQNKKRLKIARQEEDNAENRDNQPIVADQTHKGGTRSESSIHTVDDV